MTLLILIALWVFAPTIFVVLIACVMALFNVKLPESRGRESWFEKRDW